MLTRRTARLLVLDQENRILLLRFEVPGQGTFWATPGGAIEEGETYHEALVRELWEETGIRTSEAMLSGPVWKGEHDLAFGGEIMHFEETFSVARVSRPQISVTGRTPDEQSVIHGHRWWSTEELRVTSERIYPTSLAARLPAIINAELPATAINIEM